MVWAHFENEQWENPKEDFEHESKMKLPKGEGQDEDGNNRLGKMWEEL
jgi:hypothetical protein